MRKPQKFAYDVLLLFSFLGALFIPFSFGLSNVQARITKFLFEDLILYVASKFETLRVVNPEITSDSTSLYLLALILLCLAMLLALVLSFLPFWKKNRPRTVRSLQLVLVFYLSIVMLKYGFDKIFKVQFYLPEPNTLYTPLGMLDRDLLYWSTMGTSYTYNIFMGLLEVIPALMLLFSRTRSFGLFILTGVLIHVVFVNFAFDISVKLYASFLLLLCMLLLAPSMKALLSFFVLHKPALMTRISGKTLIASGNVRLVLKWVVVILFFAEAVFPTIQKGHYNDDTAPRPHLHGAYEVTGFEWEHASEGVVIPGLKRLFIHRQGYLILQYADDSMEDFRLDIDQGARQFILTGYEGEAIALDYTYSGSLETIELTFVNSGLALRLKALPWKDLPLLQPLFHWTVDEIN